MKIALITTFLLFLFLILILPPKVYASFDATISTSTWGISDSVYAIAKDSSGSVYLGGNFSKVGRNVGNAVLTNLSDGSRVTSFPRVDGEVQVVIPDGSGGWFIGGFFNHVNGIAKDKVAHILSSGELDADWGTGINNNDLDSVYDMTLSGNTLYAGGDFLDIGGQSRTCVAALDSGTGNATDWEVPVSSCMKVVTLALDEANSLLYIGGTFTNIGGQARYRTAALSTTTGLANDWNPAPAAGSGISDIIASGSYVYVAGTFTTIGGQSRKCLVQTNASNGTATEWNASITGSTITGIILSGTTIFAGGAFTVIGGQTITNLAQINISDASATAWDAHITGSLVYPLTISGNNLFISGITAVNGTSRNDTAAVDITDASLQSWNPALVDGSAYSVGVDNNYVLIGGDITFWDSVARVNLAKLKPDGSLDTDWSMDTDGTVYTLWLDGDTLYVGGDFTSIGDESRNMLASVNVDSREVLSWNPNADDTVDTLVKNGSTVYVGGKFLAVGANGQPARSYLAALDGTSGNALEWTPNPNARVYTLYADGTKVYVGGNFSNIASTPRTYIAAINTNGTLSDWNPNADSLVDDIVYSIDKKGSTVYLTGYFTWIGGAARNYLAAVDDTIGTATNWNPNPDAVVNTVYAGEDTVLVGGDFTTIGGQDRSHLAELNTTDGNATDWIGDIKLEPYYIDTIIGSGSTAYIGGNFEVVNGYPTMGFVQFGASAVEEEEEEPEPTPEPSPTPTTQPLLSTSNRSVNNSFSPLTPFCATTKPGGAPDLFQINTQKDTATLYFTPASDPYDRYFISYGTNSDTEGYSVEFDQSHSSGVVSYTIYSLTPNQVYSFKVRAGYGCATGDWSNVLTVKASPKICFYKYNNNQSPTPTLGNQLSSVIKKIVTQTGSQPAPTEQPQPTIVPSPSSQAEQLPVIPSQPKKKCFLWVFCR